VNGEQLGQLHDRCLWQRTVNAVALLDEDRTLVVTCGRDGNDDEVLHAVVEVFRRYNQGRTSLGGAQIGERKGTRICRRAYSVSRRHRPGCSRIEALLAAFSHPMVSRISPVPHPRAPWQIWPGRDAPTAARGRRDTVLVRDLDAHAGSRIYRSKNTTWPSRSCRWCVRARHVNARRPRQRSERSDEHWDGAEHSANIQGVMASA